MAHWWQLIVDSIFPRETRDERLLSITPEKLQEYLTLQRIHHDPHMMALFPYRHALIRSLITSLKYRRNARLARLFAVLLHDVLVAELADRNAFGDIEKPLFIPIPLSRRRFSKRGFNQTLLIARELQKIDGNQSYIIAESLLSRHPERTSQVAAKSKRERERNVAGAFEVAKPKNVQGRDVILFDDVVTTGSTMRAAKATLLAAGARSVFAIALAH